MRTKQKPKKSIFVRLLVIAVSFYMVFTLVDLMKVYSEKKAELTSLERQLSEKQSGIDDLRAILKDGSEKELIEKAARERFDFVDPDEEVYVAY